MSAALSVAAGCGAGAAGCDWGAADNCAISKRIPPMNGKENTASEYIAGGKKIQ
jgi:hypothetical protein